MIYKIYKSIIFKIINNFRVIRFLKNIKKIKEHNNPSVTLIIFSKDRPFQLRSLLFSLIDNMFGLSNTFIIYKASSNRMFTRYKKIVTTFRHKTFKFIEENESFKKI